MVAVAPASCSSSPARSGCCGFPDALTRLHALTKADNLGLGLIVLGLLPLADGPLAALKLIAVWLLVLLGRRHGGAAHRQRRAARGRAGMSVSLASTPGWRLVLAVAVLDDSSRATPSPRSSASSSSACC